MYTRVDAYSVINIQAHAMYIVTYPQVTRLGVTVYKVKPRVRHVVYIQS